MSPRIVTNAEFRRTRIATWAVVALSLALVIAGVLINLDWSAS